MRLNFLPFFDAASDAGGGADDLEDGFSRDLAQLETGEKPVEEEEKPESEEEPEEAPEETPEEEPEEKPEEKEKDEKEETEEEEESESELPGRPTFKDIKAAYPDITKKFPALKNIYYREQAFSEHFASPQDAKDAVEKSEEFDRFNEALSAGEPELLVKTLADNNPRALKGVASKVLGAIREADENLYFAATRPVVEDLLYYATETGKREKNNNLILAAKHLANFVFNSPEIPDVTKREGGPRKSQAEVELETRTRTWETQRFQEAASELENSAADEIRTLVTGLVSRRYKELKPYERRHIAEDTRQAVDQALLNDAAFQKQMRVLWNKARTASFSAQSKSMIRNAYMARAKMVLPASLSKTLKDAVGTLPKAKTNGEEAPQKKRTIQSSGRPASSRDTVLDPKKIDYSRTSDADILSDDKSRIRVRK